MTGSRSHHWNVLLHNNNNNNNTSNTAVQQLLLHLNALTLIFLDNLTSSSSPVSGNWYTWILFWTISPMICRGRRTVGRSQLKTCFPSRVEMRSMFSGRVANAKLTSQPGAQTRFKQIECMKS